MDKIYYAPSTRGFYAESVHGNTMPSDIVEITAALHTELLSGESAGKRIMPPDDGHDLPYLADPQMPTLEEARAAALAALTAKRLEEEYAGPFVRVGGEVIRFPSTPKDETRINSLVGVFAAQPDAELENWKVGDNTYVTMTAALRDRVALLGFTHINATFTVERLKKAEIQACETPEAVREWLAEKLDKGWPDGDEA